MKKLIYNSIKVSITSLVLLFVLILSSFTTNAQNQNDNFWVKYDGNNSTLYFQWYSNDSIDVNSTFIIWFSSGIRNTFPADSFMELCKVSYQDANQGKGYFLFQYEYKLDLNTDYSFGLQTLLPDGSSTYSNISILDKIIIEPPQTIFIDTYPSEIASLNNEYVSKISAKYIPDSTKVIYYQLEAGPDGMTVDKISGEIKWTPKSNEYAKSVIKAYLADDNNVFTEWGFQIYVRTCEIPATISGKITNKYDENVSKGYIVMYSVQGDNGEKPYEKNFSEVVNGNYSLELDAGTYYMVFYNNNGQFFSYENAKITTDMKQIHVNCNENITINWKIDNYSDKTYKVSGKVLDINGNPKTNWGVYFQSVDEKNVDGWYVLSSITDNSGNYSIELPEASFYSAYIYLDMMMENKFAANQLFYKQTFDRTKATLLNVSADLTGIDFQIIENPDFKYNVVSCKVSNENNSPLKGIMVAFEGFNENTDENYYYKYFDNVYTDENGAYSIKLPNLFKYIAYAANTTAVNSSKTYQPLFYNQTYNRDKAAIITLDKDIQGIDFKFSEHQSDYKNSISGIVVDSNSVPISNTFVEAINTEMNSPDDYYNYSYGYTDQNGQFTIKGIQPGYYILFASTQHSKEFMCGYYVENGLATINYDEATKLKIEDNIQISNLVLTLPKFATKNSGGGIIKGAIYNNSNYSDQNKAGSAINSAKIYVKENLNSLASFEESNADGTFMISGLAQGNYNFVIDKRGFELYEKLVEVNESSTTDLGLIKLIPLGTGITEENLKNDLVVYPNPSSVIISLDYFSFSNNLLIRFYSIEGTLVKETSRNVQIGINTLQINVSELHSGQYLAIFDDGKYRTAKSIIINR